MDPNQALVEVLTALAHMERDRALDHMTALVEWMTRGGLMPTVREGLVSYEQALRNADTKTFTIEVIRHG